MTLKKMSKTQLIEELQASKEKIVNLKLSQSELAQVNIDLLKKLDAERQKFPRAGKTYWAFFFALLLSIGGYFIPAEPISIWGASLHGNLYQVAGVSILAVQFIGPFLLSIVRYRSQGKDRRESYDAPKY
ncbi:MAG: hypothetical protein KDK41_11875 [Leptospiraceae bacterium]|nr:hypothetical protein [Leptospiraceae bacterium]